MLPTFVETSMQWDQKLADELLTAKVIKPGVAVAETVASINAMLSCLSVGEGTLAGFPATLDLCCHVD